MFLLTTPTFYMHPFRAPQSIGRGVLRSCTNFILKHSFLAMPEQILITSSIENVQEGTVWMALPLVEIVIFEVVEVTEDKSGVHA